MTTTKDFGLNGIDELRFAVEDLDSAERFAADWGLTRIEGADTLRFRALDGSGVEFVRTDTSDPRCTPVGDASGLVEMTWGVDFPENLEALRAELATDREAVIDDEGVLRSHDDLGFRLAFRVTRRSDVDYDVTRYNAPRRPARIDERAPRYDRAQPYEISHLAIGVDDAWQAAQFYLDRLGFRVSDRYADRGIFARCSAEGNHHNVFFMNAKQPGTRFNHLAWKVRDVHEVILGGQAFDAKGWLTFAGPGRHLVSSACFWYFLTPFGGSWEYAADEDIVTEEWQPQDFAAEAHIFSQWTFGLEKSDGTLKGPISASRAAGPDPVAEGQFAG
ncbi:Catechol-2,3-dioxygenase [Raineyella antarctica]|uniref:Catechol-2,3-dioxygenase n=1 Tax=Raineyella antarctica TaxID=1577474 RepID=A0A1G6H182_9ACTN|nr:VOC family protein [Raineyella antarctica]SDB87898.1 Catechol-2,3-dioxygenase [Raineyella antarctica]